MDKLRVISRKAEVKIRLGKVLQVYHKQGLSFSVKEIADEILNQKIKFPLLEYCAHELYRELPESEQIRFCDEVEALKTIGGNVILGIMLQNRLKDHFEQSIEKATEYISKAHAWYICDIVGERVYGYSMRHEPVKTFPVFKRLAKHENRWVVRSLGAGAHYAIKKGLEKKEVEKIFKLLLQLASTRDKEIKQGVGWAAKTTAKFHPDIIAANEAKIQNAEKVGVWFRTKIRIGLERHAYAQRN